MVLPLAVLAAYLVFCVLVGLCGSQRRMGFTSGSRSKGRNLNVHEIRRPLIKPDELVQDTRADELFVIARGCKPIRCGRAIYFRRSELLTRVKVSRFNRAA